MSLFLGIKLKAPSTVWTEVTFNVTMTNTMGIIITLISIPIVTVRTLVTFLGVATGMSIQVATVLEFFLTTGIGAEEFSPFHMLPFMVSQLAFKREGFLT